MKRVPFSLSGILVLGALVGAIGSLEAQEASTLASSAQDILRTHCFDCHGKDAKKLKGDLKILDHRALLDAERKVVVPRQPDSSKLIQMIEDGSMPSGKRPKVPEAQVKLLRQWILAGAPTFAGDGTPVRPTETGAGGELSARVHAVLTKHCLECHGPVKPKAKLQVMDREAMVQKEVLAPGKPDDSELYKRIVATDETVMPPPKKPRLAPEEIAALKEWIAAGAPALAAGAAPVVEDKKPLEKPVTRVPVEAKPDPDLAAKVKQIFKENCYQCHGGGQTKAGINVMDREQLVAKKEVVKPGSPQESVLYQVLVTTDDSARMPQPGQGRAPLNAEAIRTVEQWILQGAQPFPEEQRVDPKMLGDAYILARILDYVRPLPTEDRRFVRFFSCNHVLAGGASQAEIQAERDALALAINHLTWARRLVQPKPIDPPLNTVYAVDIRELGWDMQPFDRKQGEKTVGRSPLNIFDMALLEYPYGIIYQANATYDLLYFEFMQHTGQVRPIPYVRSDWFASVATQPPLYEDFLLMPFDQFKLERLLGVDAEANRRTNQAKRAGMTVSGVSRNNRVVERHPARGTDYYWLSFDFRTSRGRENMFKDPVNLNPTGGEIVFALPNGMQGYYVSDAKGNRIEAAPTDIVTDEFAGDRTVRNGLACMRCHDRGMKKISDDIRPAVQKLGDSPGFDKARVLEMYPDQAVIQREWKDDQDRFLAAIEKLLGRKVPEGRRPSEPLIQVSQRFLDADMSLPRASAELGLPEPTGLEPMFRTRGFAGTGLFQLAAGGKVRRDMWEDYFDQVVTSLGVGTPVVPLDALTRTDYGTNRDVDVTMVPNKRVFAPGDKLSITITNRSPRDMCIELVAGNAFGEKAILVPAPYWIKAGQKYEYKHPTPIDARTGKDQFTLYCCDREFPAGELLQLRPSEERQGRATTDRIVHPFYTLNRDGTRLTMPFDPSRMVKKTIEIETQ